MEVMSLRDRLSSTDSLENKVYISYRKNPQHDAILSAESAEAAFAAAAEEDDNIENSYSLKSSRRLDDTYQHPESDILHVPSLGVSKLKLSAATTARLSSRNHDKTSTLQI